MRHSGFTIIELMIASAIIAIVMVFTMQIFTVNNRTYIKIDSVVDTQQSIRAVASVLERDLRHAGMMVPEATAVCGVDNDDAPDLLYISDYTATNPENSIGYFDGARIQGAVSDVTGTATLTLVTLVIEPGTPDPSYDTDGNGVNDSDFNDAGGGVIIVDLMDLDRGSVCGIVTGVNLATNQIDVDIKTGGLGGAPVNYALTAVPALEYRIDSARLYRNNLRLADGIEDLQIVYFLDTNGNDAVDVGELRGDENTDYLATTSNASFLRAVRLNIVARTRSEDDRFTQGFFQATENRDAVPGQDGYRRRVHTAIVRTRNVGSRIEGT
jgi:prepilin-type N-terminal cleavage/methylation domain-containing protein